MTLGNDNGTDGQTDGQTVRRNMRPPPREEGRIIRNTDNIHMSVMTFVTN